MSQTLKQYIDEYFDNVSKRPGMYGGTLDGTETVWWTLMQFKAFELQVDRELVRDSFLAVMAKHKCGNLGLSSKAKDEKELMEWLQDVVKVFDDKVKEYELTKKDS